MSTPEQIYAAECWEQLPEDQDERRIFDHEAKLVGGPLMAIAIALTVQARQYPPQGSLAKWCAIAANEVARAVARGVK